VTAIFEAKKRPNSKPVYKSIPRYRYMIHTPLSCMIHTPLSCTDMMHSFIHSYSFNEP